MSYFVTLWCRSPQSSKRSHTLRWTCWGRVWERSGVCLFCLLSHFDGSQSSPFLLLRHVLRPSGDSENTKNMLVLILSYRSKWQKNRRHIYFYKLSTLSICESNKKNKNNPPYAQYTFDSRYTHRGRVKGSNHLKSFAEHVFPFFTPQ